LQLQIHELITYTILRTALGRRDPLIQENCSSPAVDRGPLENDLHQEKKLITLAEYVAAMPEDQAHIYYSSGDGTNRLDKLPQSVLTSKFHSGIKL
jgi:HSP90 family molecular chaperone